MKQCPQCKNEVDEKTQVCPHCGYRFNGYQPMKRSQGSQKKNGSLLIPLLVFFTISMAFNYYISSNLYSSNNMIYSPSNKVTLGPLGDVKNKTETMVYQFDNLKDFKNSISGVDQYCKNIETFENSLLTITDTKEIDKNYQIVVTDLNNIYYFIDYQMAVDDNVVKVTLRYDIGGAQNDSMIECRYRGFPNFEAMKVTDDNYVVFKELYQLVSGKDLTLFNQAAKDLLKLEPKVEERKDRIGSYGITSTTKKKENQISFHIDERSEGYQVRLNYKGELDTKLLLKK